METLSHLLSDMYNADTDRYEGILVCVWVGLGGWWVVVGGGYMP
jgi:hypothetical protein